MANSSYNELIEIDLAVEQPAQDPFEALINNCMILLFEDRYEDVTDTLRHSENLFAEQQPTQQLGILLGAASYRPMVTVEVFQTIISIDPTAALFRDAGNRTPLHMAAMYLDRPDLARLLVEAAPRCVHIADLEGLRAIDILTQRILMKEEHIRYLGHHKSIDDEQAIQRNWETAQIMILARYSTSAGQEYLSVHQPFLHVMVQAPDIPLSITERALRRYKDQLLLADDDGNLPLHHIAGRGPTEDMDVFNEVLQACPNAAGIANKYVQLPFNLAIQAERRFDSGISSLLTVFPDPLGDLQLAHGVFPLVLAEWLGNGKRSLAFKLIKANPEIVGE